MVTLFSYKPGNTVFHKLDARIKLVLLFACAFVIFSLPLELSVILCAIACMTLLAAGFTVREIASLFKVVLYYALVIYCATLFSSFFDGSAANVFAHDADSHDIANAFMHDESERNVGGKFSSMFFSYSATLLTVSVRTSDVLLVARLALAILVTSLLYRTTSPLALREAIEDAEQFVLGAFRKKAMHIKNLTPSEQTVRTSCKTTERAALFSSSLSLLLTFIPLVFATWKSVTRAWKARRGKSGIRMMLTLLPVFFSVCMKKAHTTSLALQNRTIAV